MYNVLCFSKNGKPNGSYCNTFDLLPGFLFYNNTNDTAMADLVMSDVWANINSKAYETSC